MAQRSSSGGCLALVATLVAAVVGMLLLGFIILRKSPGPDQRLVAPVQMTGERAGDAISFTEAARPRLSVPGPGEPVRRDQFTAYMMDRAATELARAGFRQAAEGGRIEWKLRLKQLSERSGKLHGEFDLPWEIRHDHGSSGGSYHINVQFDEAARDSLLKLRVGDWVTVEGRLTFKTGQATVVDAIPAGLAVAEKP